MKEVLEQKLAATKATLEKRKKNFCIMVGNEIDTSCFEKNAINELIVMLELKRTIETLEHDIQMAGIWQEA